MNTKQQGTLEFTERLKETGVNMGVLLEKCSVSNNIHERKNKKHSYYGDVQ